MEKNSENTYKLEMAIKDIDKLKSAIHKLEVDLSVMTEKVNTQYEFISDKINFIVDSIKFVMPEKKIAHDETLMDFVSRHSVSIQFIVIIIILVVSPESIKSYVLNRIL